jgi:hypothetical protein
LIINRRLASFVVRLVPKDSPPLETNDEVLPFPKEEERYNIQEIVDRINSLSEPEKIAIVLRMVLRDKMNDCELAMILYMLYGQDEQP